MKTLWLIVLANVTAAPAAANPVTMWFTEAPEDVAGKIANLCAERSSMVLEQDRYHVLCSREVSGMGGILTQALIGNSYSTTPELKFRFSLIRQGDVTMVQASQWVETQMAMGQLRREQLDGKKQNQRLIDALGSIGGTPVAPADVKLPTNTDEF